MAGTVSQSEALRDVSRAATRGNPRPALVVRCARASALTLAAALTALVLFALPYYSSSAGARVRHPLHALLRPSGAVGQTLGWLGLSLFLFLWLYPVRKRLGRRFGLGPIPAWLDVHIIAGLSVPFVAAMHAGWRFQGLIGLGYGAMFVVCLSGIVGRYLYVHLPRSRNGMELTREEVAAERRQLLHDLAITSGRPMPEIQTLLGSTTPGPPTLNPLRVLLRMAHDDVARQRAVRRLRRSLGRAPHAPDVRTLREIARTARREVALAQQARMLEGIQRILRWWHAAHMPFAVTALIAVLLHVGVAIWLGQTWLR